MTDRLSVAPLGPPSIALDALRIWVHGRQFPDSLDYWDGNWMNVTAECARTGSSVLVSGPLIHLSELQSWASTAAKLYETLTGESILDCMEPELRVTLKAVGRGRITATVQITPDHLNESHRFTLDIDQSYLPAFLSQCRAVLEAYPIRDPEKRLPTGSVTHS